MNRTITVTWRAFSRADRWAPEASRTFTVDSPLDDLRLCEQVYRDTNLYEGPIWEAMQPLPQDRSHTALSVIFGNGDHVQIDSKVYEVAEMGFKEVGGE